MKPGDSVEVKLFGGGAAVRKLIAIKGDRYVVCSEQELAEAKAAGRQPLTLAFPKVDVIGIVPDENLSAPRKGPQAEQSQPEPVRRSSAGD